MATSKSNENLYLLGRTPKQIGMVSRNTQNIVMRPNLRFPKQSFNGRTSESFWATRMKINCEAFQTITCSQCVNYLTYIFDASEQPIIMGGLYTTPAKFLISLPSVATHLASTIGPIQFKGGPPTQPGVYKGSLLTLLIDAMLQAVAINNKKILRRVQNTPLSND